jgi:hypothetical protein
MFRKKSCLQTQTTAATGILFQPALVTEQKTLAVRVMVSKSVCAPVINVEVTSGLT